LFRFSEAGGRHGQLGEQEGAASAGGAGASSVRAPSFRHSIPVTPLTNFPIFQ